MKNKNPMNIRKTNQPWVGKLKSNNDFECFEDDVYSFRAATRIIRTYNKRGINTIAGIISRYAPAVENNTDEYVKFVCKKMSMSPIDKLNLSNNDVMAALIQAMARYESGMSYDIEHVKKGVALA